MEQRTVKTKANIDKENTYDLREKEIITKIQEEKKKPNQRYTQGEHQKRYMRRGDGKKNMKIFSLQKNALLCFFFRFVY